LQSAMLHWIWILVADLAIISFAFASTELLCGAGRALPTFRCGCGGSQTHVGRAKLAGSGLVSACSAWLRGAAALATVWALSITIAPDIRGVADAVAGHPVTNSEVLVPVLASCCLALYAFHAWVLSRQTPCSCRSASDDQCGAYGIGCVDEEDPSSGLLPVSPSIKGNAATDSSPEGSSPNRVPSFLRLALKGGAFSIQVLVAVLSAALGATEGPVFSWALGSAYRSLHASRWLLMLIPWEHVAPKVAGWKVSHPIYLLATMTAGALGLGGVLAWARRSAESSAGRKASLTSALPSPFGASGKCPAPAAGNEAYGSLLLAASEQSPNAVTERDPMVSATPSLPLPLGPDSEAPATAAGHEASGILLRAASEQSPSTPVAERARLIGDGDGCEQGCARTSSAKSAQRV